MSNKRNVTASRTNQTSGNPDCPQKSQQMLSPSPDKPQRDVEIIRKVFAACDER
jgi:hypothetical protein